jgi:hypothetical protein
MIMPAGQTARLPAGGDASLLAAVTAPNASASSWHGGPAGRRRRGGFWSWFRPVSFLAARNHCPVRYLAPAPREVLRGAMRAGLASDGSQLALPWHPE